MNSLNKELASITDINKVLLDRLSDTAGKCIIGNVLIGESTTEIDIGYGILTIKIINDEITYNFKPKEKFEHELITAIQTGRNPVIKIVTSSLVKKLQEFYGVADE